jgi:tetrahydromethanopterin S-methyltransferase subunit G
VADVGHPSLICLIIIHRFVPVGWQLVDELRRDEELRRALAEALGWRVPANVATKEDIKALEDDIDALKSYVDTRFDDTNRRIDDINKRIDDINRRIDDLNGIVRASLVAIAVTLASTILVPLILRVLLGP